MSFAYPDASVSRRKERKKKKKKTRRRIEEDAIERGEKASQAAYASPCVRDRKYEYPARLVWASLRASLFSLSLSLGLVTGKRYSGCSRAGAVPTLGRVRGGAPSMTVGLEERSGIGPNEKSFVRTIDVYMGVYISRTGRIDRVGDAKLFFQETTAIEVVEI